MNHLHNNTPEGLFSNTPEGLFRMASNAPSGYPLDAIDCALDRADAVILMLAGQFDGSNEDRLHDRIISNVLSAIHSEVRLIRTMIEHGNSTKPQRQSPTKEA